MNKIGWCTDTINPITGCLNGCDYCYARKFANRLRGRFGYPEDEPFRPTFHPDKLQEIYNLPNAPRRVFLDSMSDWFSPGVDPAWIEATITAVKARPEHTFLVLTKRPDRIAEVLGGIYKVPDNLWLGVSVTEQTDTWRIKELSIIQCHRFVSFEPLHGPISTDLSMIHWVIIGAESGNRKGKIVPDVEWIDRLFFNNQNIPVFMKDNLRPIIGDIRGIIQEFPEAMR